MLRIGLVMMLTVAATPGQGAPGCGGVVDNDNVLFVSKKEARCPWAFKLSEVALICIKDAPPFGGAVLVISQGKYYPLNGNARDLARVLRGDMDSVKEIVTSQQDAAAWIKPGLALCEAGGSRFR